MTALIGAEIEQAEEVAREASAAGGTCVVANDNAPGQVVISGTLDALARAAEIAKAKGIKRAMPLAVRAPFHSPADAARRRPHGTGAGGRHHPPTGGACAGKCHCQGSQ